VIIPHNIGEEACWAALDSLLKATWRTQTGLRVALDMLAIDGGTYTEDVWAFSKRHRWDRVIIVKGSGSQNGPVMLPMKFERRTDGQAKRQQKRAFMLNVSQMKADFYNWLAKTDPLERGFVQFAGGLGDEYYRQVTAEVRVLKRTRGGAVVSQWDLVEASRRNEMLDTMLYAEAAARRKGWTSLTADQWGIMTAERGAVPPESGGQGDLFDTAATTPDPLLRPPPAAEPAAPAHGQTPTPRPAEKNPGAVAPNSNWIRTREDWL
jgi:phage terminase large subunit GpA-like protein